MSVFTYCQICDWCFFLKITVIFRDTFEQGQLWYGFLLNTKKIWQNWNMELWGDPTGLFYDNAQDYGESDTIWIKWSLYT